MGITAARAPRLFAGIIASANFWAPDALVKHGIDVQTNTPEQFGAFIDRELAQNLKLIKASGAKAE